MLDWVGCRDPRHEGRGDGGRGAMATNAKRGLLRAVPNARRAGVNFKKLPLISHKAAANRTDALEVMTA
jgi:hypothetical protein